MSLFCLAAACCFPAASYVVVAADVMHDPFGFASKPALPRGCGFCYCCLQAVKI